MLFLQGGHVQSRFTQIIKRLEKKLKVMTKDYETSSVNLVKNLLLFLCFSISFPTTT